MAPAAIELARRGFAPGAASRDFSAQWKNPGDVFSVLLILGGDVVARALAQLSGSKITPVAFSFGWVAYAVSAVVSAVGDNKLMPPPDTSCQVINAKSGFSRTNSSWIIGRIVRDYDDWKHEKVSKHLKTLLDARDKFDRQKANEERRGAGDTLKYPKRAGLCVAVYKAEEAHAGVPGYDFVYWLGFGTCILQLGIAAIPCGIYGDWATIQITAVGMLLSFLTGSLPQWKHEKWACRDKCDKDIILTKGNGSQHTILILGQGQGFDLEDLAAGQIDTDLLPKATTRFALLVLAVLWVLLLITAAGIKQNTWFLLAIGGVGIAQNIYAAGKTRTPAAYGMPLTLVEVIGSPKVMETLFAVEKKYPYAGSSMVGTFFPGGRLTDDEKTEWQHLEYSAKDRREAWEEQQFK
ncbi:hypothetical protein LMH87_001299 [Akanthomyces muscarius]|uniref:Uncharacterized protein n=1 Tax=Akanthomyces muscarius TaxID=2231603 RepID=A0A9W8QGS8_AKAMU|nr:hypothetical protein LMH87_001299 [Akanthomyces muscarius]KAJ4156085.1 hypothetical protein LMH87_001299 [Akanthomyces muscarius]